MHNRRPRRRRSGDGRHRHRTANPPGQGRRRRQRPRPREPGQATGHCGTRSGAGPRPRRRRGPTDACDPRRHCHPPRPPPGRAGFRARLQITGNQTYLNQARYAFDRLYNRGWDGVLGGGIWWDIRKRDKNALSNSPAAVLGCLIYESNGDRGYLDKARAIFDWVWERLLDRSTGSRPEPRAAEPAITVASNSSDPSRLSCSRHDRDSSRSRVATDQ
ncbi:glycoside hydrolase family 76 protein [Streptomyces sp. NPDC020731]|uniref:glycoside hydrolase family 76 protein n=1 Tax=Streptomyces sp. NPDC020731 TaxID=3365085 RepID=UPI003796A37B